MSHYSALEKCFMEAETDIMVILKDLCDFYLTIANPLYKIIVLTYNFVK